jgi:hypothetical protein
VHDDGRRREAGDPDDYRGGFAVWSGTSFAAPLVAGRIAYELGSSMLGDTTLARDAPDPLDSAVTRALGCTTVVTDALGAADHSKGPQMS